MLGSLKDRLADMVKANVYDLLELAELLPSQTATDLDQSERFARDELGRQIADQHRLSSRVPALEAAHDQARKQAEDAVANGRDDQARMAIAKQLDLEHQIKAQQARASELSQSITALETLLTKLAAARKHN